MDTTSLEAMLAEPIESVVHREQHALEELLLARGNRLVLFGSGNLGRRAARALEAIGIHPLAFSDNNQSLWGTEVNGLDVLAPAEAARLYGNNSTLLVTIWNEFHWFRETADQLTSYGCDQVAPYTFLHWRFPQQFLPCLLNDLPHKVFLERDSVLAAAELWADPNSQAIYQANIELRAHGILDNLPGRPIENTYFPCDLFTWSDEDCFLDCGATTGEMLADLIRKRGGRFSSFSAIEADNISFPKLDAYRAQLPDDVRAKVKLYDCAVGATRCMVHFGHSGQTGSKISTEGVAVDCFPIDELFRDKRLTYIKMDIEGAEYDAILGAANVMQRDLPILAICVYHTQNDIWRIPLLVHRILPQHKLYLREYEGDGFQTVMYAIPPERTIDRQPARQV